jgi:hypothetical protein
MVALDLNLHQEFLNLFFVCAVDSFESLVDLRNGSYKNVFKCIKYSKIY